MERASGLLRLLGDETRLRLLRALSHEALNVSELTAGVSRHLGLLREAGLVGEDRSGAFSWYRLTPDAGAAGEDRAALWAWLRAEFARPTPATREDDARLEEVRRLRQETFDEHRADAAERSQLVPGRSWAAWSRALGLLLPALEVADLGCGEGYLTLEMARWARRVVGFDQSADVLAGAKALAGRRRVRNITWKRGTLDRVPLGDATVDVALLSQALHHADKPAAALAEAWRILRPGGRVLILDLRAHDQAWLRTKLGDRWLGFDDQALEALVEGAGFKDVTVRVGAKRTGDPFTVLVAAGLKRRSGKDNA